jgi:hypothetical protein
MRGGLGDWITGLPLWGLLLVAQQGLASYERLG